MSRIVEKVKIFDAELTKRNVSFPISNGGRLKSHINADNNDKKRNTVKNFDSFSFLKKSTMYFDEYFSSNLETTCSNIGNPTPKIVITNGMQIISTFII